MSCENYDELTEKYFLDTTEHNCRYESGCSKDPESCKWGSLLRQVSLNMRIEDTPEDFAQDRVLAMLEAQNNIICSSRGQTPKQES